MKILRNAALILASTMTMAGCANQPGALASSDRTPAEQVHAKVRGDGTYAGGTQLVFQQFDMPRSGEFGERGLTAVPATATNLRTLTVNVPPRSAPVIQSLGGLSSVNKEPVDSTFKITAGVDDKGNIQTSILMVQTVGGIVLPPENAAVGQGAEPFRFISSVHTLNSKLELVPGRSSVLQATSLDAGVDTVVLVTGTIL